jgi:hypothetical protein
LITGEVIPVRKEYGDRMDVDGEEYDEDEDDEDDEYGVLPETKVLLVSEEKFESESFLLFSTMACNTNTHSFQIAIHAYILHTHIRTLPGSDTRKS